MTDRFDPAVADHAWQGRWADEGRWTVRPAAFGAGARLGRDEALGAIRRIQTPPVTSIVNPVTKSASCEARKQITPAWSLACINP